MWINGRQDIHTPSKTGDGMIDLNPRDKYSVLRVENR